jgi:hypothetical protein
LAEQHEVFAGLAEQQAPQSVAQAGQPAQPSAQPAQVPSQHEVIGA